MDQGYAFKVVTKLEDADGNDIFAMNEGAGKYGCSELEQVRLAMHEYTRIFKCMHA